MVVNQIPCRGVVGKKGYHTIVIRKKVVVPPGQKVLPEAISANFLSEIESVGKRLRRLQEIESVGKRLSE